ncbi:MULTISPECIES: DedA family protein [unclassified Leucobacter]|uniref:DedA family protein n=1 Tax=unclassified Leucobacter TaxID=2621730 RepID=UPI00165DC18E|nr:MULTISPECIES: DedA family protein [unclassified Leucobacter]MBC9926884.1 DedA family protein [Leucobacter sp. cx-169]MBC9935154.1 DedA family protein [Leucobacter sp. cx-87]
MTELLEQFFSAVRDMDPVWRTLLAALGLFLETSAFIGLVVPGDSIALIAASGVSTPAQFAWLIAALVIGALLGESVGFWLGRHFGPRIRASRLGRRLGERNWLLAERYLGERGGVAVMLSRFLPVLHSLVPLSAGMAGMRFRRFLAWTIPACIVWAVIVASLGASAAAGFQELASRVSGAGYIFVALVLVVVAVIWLLKRLIFRLERRHLGIPED